LCFGFTSGAEVSFKLVFLKGEFRCLKGKLFAENSQLKSEGRAFFFSDGESDYFLPVFFGKSGGSGAAFGDWSEGRKMAAELGFGIGVHRKTFWG
jgi:hypothetical protein